MGHRVLGLDFLRGLCALGVAYYHILGFLGSNVKLYSVGLYGVYVFFVLSGTSIYIAYADRILSGYDIRRFLGQRVFRLFPLFALVVLIGPLIDYGNYSRYDPEFFEKALLNITFTFGLGNPGQLSLATGGWSIGIEFVFYLLFPMILAFVAGGWTSGVSALLFVAMCQYIFVGNQITGTGALSNNWRTYIEFASFPAYFVAGCLIGKVIKSTEIRLNRRHWQLPLWAAFATIAAAILFSSGSSPEDPLLGTRKQVLPLLCAVLVLVSAFVRFPKPIAYMATILGSMSYGMYLLHPLVFSFIKRVFPQALMGDKLFVASGIIVITAMIALLLERTFERPITELGKRMLNRGRSSSFLANAAPQ